MYYHNEAYACKRAEQWKVPTSTLNRWRRSGILPDRVALHDPLDSSGRLVEEKLIRLVESGWLKGRAVGRLWLVCTVSEQKVNALIATRRNPDSPHNNVHHLYGDEVARVKTKLDELHQAVDYMLYLGSLEGYGKSYGGDSYSFVVQQKVRFLLRRAELSRVAITTGMDEQQKGRFKAFIRGQGSKRKDLDTVLDRLKALVGLLAG